MCWCYCVRVCCLFSFHRFAFTFVWIGACSSELLSLINTRCFDLLFWLVIFVFEFFKFSIHFPNWTLPCPFVDLIRFANGAIIQFNQLTNNPNNRNRLKVLFFSHNFKATLPILLQLESIFWVWHTSPGKIANDTVKSDRKQRQRRERRRRRQRRRRRWKRQQQ